MNLNHINLTVSDPVEAQAFLERFFGMTSSRKGNKNMAVVSDGLGMTLSLMSPKMGKESTISYPATFHIGFMQDTEEEVDRLSNQLREAGHDAPEPSKQHGSWTFYYDTPWGITIEVGA